MQESGVGSFLNNAIGASCWHVCAGGNTWPHFSLALGDKIAREHPLSNDKVGEAFRNFDGEIDIYVRCCWRLLLEGGIVATSQSEEQEGSSQLQLLHGKKLEAINLRSGFDLRLTFESGILCEAFCDKVGGDPELNNNWEVRIRNTDLYCGPGGNMKFADST